MRILNMHAKILALSFWLLLSGFGRTNPVEINLPSGSYVFAYFNAPSEPKFLTPITQFSNHLDRFSNQNATLHIDLKIGNDNPVLQIDRWLDNLESFSCRENFRLINNKGFVFGNNVELGRLIVRQSENLTVIIQKFYDRTERRDNELVVIISKDSELIRRSVKIPDTYVAWNWDFNETFDYLANTLKNKE